MSEEFTLPDGDRVTEKEFEMHKKWPTAFWWFNDQLMEADAVCSVQDRKEIDENNLHVFEQICLAVEKQYIDRSSNGRT